MTGIDTNILVRLLAKDDEKQYQKIIKWLGNRNQNESIFINTIVLIETVWVLQRVLQKSRKDIELMIENLLLWDIVVFENREVLQNTLEVFKTTNADFSDVYIGEINLIYNCAETVTFDKKATTLSTMNKL